MNATDLNIGSPVLVILPTGATRPGVIVSPSPMPETWTVTVFLDRRYDGGELLSQIENVTTQPWRPGTAAIVIRPSPAPEKAPDQPTPYPNKTNGRAKPRT